MRERDRIEDMWHDADFQLECEGFCMHFVTKSGTLGSPCVLCVNGIR